jgi:superfamily II DNA/RNA helicase
MQDAELIRIQAKEMTVDLTDQSYIEVMERKKFDILCNILDIQSPELAIVFGRTKKRVDEVFEALQKRGYSAEALHGDLTQSRRDQVMRRFKQNQVDILVATDVACPGDWIFPASPMSSTLMYHRIRKAMSIVSAGRAAQVKPEKPSPLSHHGKWTT